MTRGLRPAVGALLAAMVGLAACSAKHHDAADASAAATSRPAAAPTASPPRSPSPHQGTAEGSDASRANRAPTATHTAPGAGPGATPGGGEGTTPGSAEGATPGDEGTAPAGAEGATAGSVGQCRLVSQSAVVTAFDGKVSSATASMSGIGNPICLFTLTQSNAGLPGTLSVTVNSRASAKTFALIRKSQPGAVTVPGVGDGAFYVPSTATLQLIKGSAMAVVQAMLRAPGGTAPAAARVKADVVALGKDIAATL